MGAGPYLERMPIFDEVLGYNINRIADALSGNRSQGAVASVDAFVYNENVALTANVQFIQNFYVPTIQVDTLIKAYFHWTIGTPSSLSIAIDGTDRTAALGGPFTTAQVANIDLTTFLSTGWHTLGLTSTATVNIQWFLQLQTLFNHLI